MQALPSLMTAQGWTRRAPGALANRRKHKRTLSTPQRGENRLGNSASANWQLTFWLSAHSRFKVGSKYYSTSMDFTKIPEGPGTGIYTEEKVTLPLRILSEEEAKAAVWPWLNGSKEGYKAIKLFDHGAARLGQSQSCPTSSRWRVKFRGAACGGFFKLLCLFGTTLPFT